MEAQDYPMIDEEMDDATVAKLQRVVDNPETLQIDKDSVEIWEDDSCPCVGFIMNGVMVSFWWEGYLSAAAPAYAHDSPSARQAVIDMIKHQIGERTKYIKERDNA